MKYKTAVKQIHEVMDSYRAEINKIERNYIARVNAVEKTIKEMSSKWTEEGQNEYRRENAPKAEEYTALIKNAQERARTVADYNLSCIRREMDAYFRHPVRPEFATRITAIATSGMRVTNYEFKLLQEEAIGYGELRLLQAKGENRMKTQQQVALVDGTPKAEETKVKDAYYIDLPDLDSTYAALTDYENEVRGTIKYYSGESAALAQMLPGLQDSSDGVSMYGLGTSYYRVDADGNIGKAIDAANEYLPNNGVKAELTEHDKKIIDAIIPPEDFEKYKFATKSRIKELCMNDQEMRDLFSLDPRYAEFIPKGGGEDE